MQPLFNLQISFNKIDAEHKAKTGVIVYNSARGKFEIASSKAGKRNHNRISNYVVVCYVE